MSRLFILTILSFILCQCTSKDQPTDTITTEQHTDSLANTPDTTTIKTENIATDSTNFTAAFNHFLAAVQASDAETINDFIHPDYGLWIIEQPGAVPKMSLVENINNFKREFQGRSFFTIKDEVKTCNLQQETWPTFDCADMNYDAGQSGYSKDGCFVSGPEKFQKSGYWNYADLPLAQVKRIQTTLPRVQKSVLHTATSFEFHFGYIDNRWNLLFAKLIYPCSA